MEQKLGRTPAMILSILTAAGAYLLRADQLATSFDATGRMVVGAGKGLLTWFCLVMAAVFAVYSFLLRPRSKYSAIAANGPVILSLTLLSAVVMVLGCVQMALDLEQLLDLLLAAGGVVTAICWVAVGLDRYRGRKAPAPLFMVPALFYALELICEFRFWSRDPQILDYCFELLALISVMCATFHLGGFCFDKGRRRATVFFCFCGIFFSAAALADGDRAIHAAAILWLLTNLHPLLRPVRKRQSEDE